MAKYNAGAKYGDGVSKYDVTAGPPATAGYDAWHYDDPAAVYDGALAPAVGIPTDTPLPHVRVLWRPEQFTRVSNPGFETNTAGWSVAASINAAGTSITRITTDHYRGSACGQLVTSAVLGSGCNFDLGGDRYYTSGNLGTAYVALVWLKRVSGASHAQLVFGSAGTPADRAVLDIELRNAWTPYRVVWKPSAARTDAEVAITNDYAAVLTVLIDELRVYQLDAMSQLENSNLPANSTGWDVSGVSGIAGAATSVTRVTTDGMDPLNQTCGELVTTAVSGSGVNYALGNRLFTAGRTYRLRVAAKSISGSTSLRLRLGSIGTAADRGDTTVTLSSAWQLFSVDWTPSANRTDACAALSNASAAVADLRFGLAEVYEASDDVSSPYLAAMAWTRGSDRQDFRTPASTLQVTLNDSGRRFFPTNGASPLAGSLAAGRRVWARASYASQVFGVFFGTLQTITPDGFALTVGLTAQDPLLDLANLDYESDFAGDQSYNQVRAAVLAPLPATRRALTNRGVEGEPFFSGNDSATALSVLEDMNEATGTFHHVQPSAVAEELWQYTTLERAAMTDATSSQETINDDFADLAGVLATDEALENRQFVNWQSYELRNPSLDTVVQAYARSYDPSLLDDDDPYLHFRDPTFGNDNNIPAPTFERITRHKKKKGRKVVRQVRIYPDAFVPFTMAPGDHQTHIFDFSIAMGGISVGVDGPTGAANIAAVLLESSPRHAVVLLFANAADTVDRFFLSAYAWYPADEQIVDMPAYDSIVTSGLHEGQTVQSPYIGSLGMAEGLANYRNWRYSVSRMRPSLRTENRSATALARQLGDHVTVNAARWGIAGQAFAIVGIGGQMDTGARSWVVTYQLEELPAGAPWFTLDSSTLDSAVSLAY